MGELIKILDFLQKRHYAQYCWAYDASKFIPVSDWHYIGSLEDGHGYSAVRH